MLKTRVLSVIFLSFVILAVASCTSSKKLLKRGDYYGAVMTATAKLKKRPGNNKAQAALKRAFPLALHYFEDQIRKTKISGDPFQWSTIAKTYQSMNHMYEAIQSTPAARRIIGNPPSFYKEYAKVKEKAAAEQYRAGEEALANGTREGAKEAYYFFLRAGEYVPNFKDINRKMAEAKKMGTLIVVVEPQSVPSRFYKVSADFFYDQVNNYLRNRDRSYEFIDFYTSQEARRKGIRTPDQVLQLRFEDFVVGQTNTFRNKETISRDSVKIGETQQEGGEKQPIYGKVKATLISTRIEVISGGILSMTVLDGYDGSILNRHEMNGEFIWHDAWATFQGDERALTPEQLALCKHQAMAPPPPQDLFVQFTKPIYDQLTSQIDRFYRNYL